jgi:hypothetical protein
MKLLFFGRAAKRCRRAFAAGDHLGDIIEVSGANFVLMFCSSVPIRFRGKLGFL